MPIEIVTGAEAQANVAGMPANVLVYGGPGTGKTTDAVTMFTRDGRCSAFYIPFEDGALKPILARGLPVPDGPKLAVKTWPALCEALQWLLEHHRNYTGVILDGLTPFSAYIYSAEQQRGHKNKFDVPLIVRQNLFNLREWIRQLGLHSIFIAHAEPPAVQEGVFYHGAMKLAPRSIVREYFGQIDTVLRVDWLQVPGRAPMRVYYTGGEDWPTSLGPILPPDLRHRLVKNREGCNQAVVPADLGAFLRSRRPAYTGL